MLYCEKGTSVLFPPIDKVVQVYRCHIVKLFAPTSGSCKKTQQNIICADECIGPHHNASESVCINTDLLETCPISSCDRVSSKSELTRKVKMHEIDDSLLNSEPPLMKGAKLSIRGKQAQPQYMHSDSKKLFRRKRRGQVSRGSQNDKPQKQKTVSKKVATDDKKSLISLYRTKRYSNADKYKCKCHAGKKVEKLDNIDKENKKPLNLEDLKLELKPKIENNNHSDIKKLTDETCFQGICSKAAKNKEKDFECTCKYKKEPAVTCWSKTCSKEDAISKKSSLVKFINRVTYIYEKIRGLHTRDLDKLCKGGICMEASNRQNPNISCMCKQKINTCGDETCIPNKKKLNPTPSQSQRMVLQLKQMLGKKFKSPRKEKKLKQGTIQKTVVQNEIEQTGDPLFEIKVNAMDMSVLNPSEIKDKVLTLGEKKKRHQCVCPSHAVRKQYILEREACLGGPCKKALKNKTTDFACKCLKNKIWTCTDSTCDKPATSNNYSTYNPEVVNKPLFEVQVDTEKMCIINTNEIQDKLRDVHQRRNKLCRAGICMDKSQDRNTRIVCKCHKEMNYNECTENTCGKDIRKKYIKKTNQSNQNRMIRNGFDTTSIKNIKSTFSLFYSRMRSKSDNFINQNIKRKKRTYKKHNGMIRTQSENVHKRDGLKLKIKKHKDEECGKKDCCKCDNNKDKHNKLSNLKKILKPPKVKAEGDSKAQSDNKAENYNKAKNNNNNEEEIKQKHSNKPQKKIATEKKVHKRKGLVVPVPSSIVRKKSKQIPIIKTKKKPESICKCLHDCRCEEEMEKRRWKELEQKMIHGKKDEKRKLLDKRRKLQSNDKKWAQETSLKRKEFAKEKLKLLKEEQARTKAKNKKQKAEEKEVLRLLESEGGANRNNCIVEILVALLSVGISAIKNILLATFYTIFNPKKSFFYVRERLNDPMATWALINRSFRQAWKIRQLKICNCVKNSDNASILLDSIKSSAVYQMFADKGKTKKQQEAYDVENKARVKRIKRRREKAIYGCRHVLLSTLRRTPCLWVYHVCPNFYPQCLSILGLMNQFGQIAMFVFAVMCWTPCIVLCELARGLCCCLLCTG